MTHRIIMEACLKHRLMPKAFFDSHLRFGAIVIVRAEVIRTMRDMGMSYGTIARLVRRDKTTISYWLRPDQRTRRMNFNRRRQRERRAEALAKAAAELGA